MIAILRLVAMSQANTIDTKYLSLQWIYMYMYINASRIVQTLQCECKPSLTIKSKIISVEIVSLYTVHNYTHSPVTCTYTCR